MDKQRLTTLINQPEKLEEKDFKDLKNLKEEFPYFQALSPLITIVSKKYKLENEKEHLQSAAIYALDRKHLKKILTEENSSIDQQTTSFQSQNKIVGLQSKAEQAKTVKEKENEKISTGKENTDISQSSHLPESFFEDLFKEMDALKAEKEKYQKTLEKFESENATPTKTKAKTTTARKSSSKTSDKKTPASKATSRKKTAVKKSPASKKTTTSKKTSSTKAKETKKKPSTSKATKTTAAAEKKPKKDEHDIIEEITSRKELKINDAHKKEQLDIINNFIEKEPVLTKRLDPDNQSNKQEAEDLSANSTNLSDDVVSETLAKLMVKQGRKQKAIDIYKKLIWKFPQKKTYFVEIIDELKKES